MASDTQMVTLRMSTELLSAVDRRAAEAGDSRSGVMRAALQEFLGIREDRGLSLTSEQRAALGAVSERYGIERLELFGSRGRGEARSNSDVDLLYTLKPGVRLGWEIEDLSAALQSIFGRPVDLVSRKSLHPLLKDSVLAEVQLLVCGHGHPGGHCGSPLAGVSGRAQSAA